jgi:DNA-binding transcriptional MerR regulator
MSDGVMTIGAFSRASYLSVKMLRAYHEAGILEPAHVDPRTGYRQYHSSQLVDAAVILRLRSLDLPLDQVRRIVTARDPEVTRALLADHTTRMQARLDEVSRIVAELQDTAAHPQAHTPVHVRDQPATPTLRVRGRVNEATFAKFLDRAYADLDAAVGRLGVTPSGPPGALYGAEIADDTDEEVEAFLPLAEPVEPGDLGRVGGLGGLGGVGGGAGDGDVGAGLVPAARVAVVAHRGPYDTLSDSYRRLGAWVADNAASAHERVREWYLVSYGQTDDTERFLTEVHWPILPSADR